MSSVNNQGHIGTDQLRRLSLNLLALPLFFVFFMFLPAGSWDW